MSISRGICCTAYEDGAATCCCCCYLLVVFLLIQLCAKRNLILYTSYGQGNLTHLIHSSSLKLTIYLARTEGEWEQHNSEMESLCVSAQEMTLVVQKKKHWLNETATPRETGQVQFVWPGSATRTINYFKPKPRLDHFKSLSNYFEMRIIVVDLIWPGKHIIVQW